MLNFICFGSGSSGNSSLIETENDSVIIDAGIGIRTLKKYYRQYCVNTSNIRGILITHDHSDHICSAGILSTYLNVNIYVSDKLYKKILVCNNRYRIEKKRIAVFDSEKPFKLGDFLITPFKIPHDATENFGYSLSYNDEVFTLMTDIGKPTDEVESYIKKSNYLVIEADYDTQMLSINPRYDNILKQRITGGYGHLSNQQTSQLLFDNYHDKLVFIALCHLSQENNTPDLAANTIRDKLKEKKIIDGVDYKLEILKRKEVSGPWCLIN